MKQAQPLLKKDQDEFSANAPIKMMGGQVASRISSAIKINQMSSESDYDGPESEKSDSDQPFHVVPRPET